MRGLFSFLFEFRQTSFVVVWKIFSILIVVIRRWDSYDEFFIRIIVRKTLHTHTHTLERESKENKEICLNLNLYRDFREMKLAICIGVFVLVACCMLNAKAQDSLVNFTGHSGKQVSLTSTTSCLLNIYYHKWLYDFVYLTRCGIQEVLQDPRFDRIEPYVESSRWQ